MKAIIKVKKPKTINDQKAIFVLKILIGITLLYMFNVIIYYYHNFTNKGS